MTSEAIFNKVGSMIAEIAGLDIQEVTPASILTDIGLDSLDAVNLISELEEEFNIEISNEEIFGIKSVQDVISAIERNR